MNIPTRDVDQKELTKPLNTPERPNSLKKNIKTLGNKSVNLVVVLIIIVSDTPNKEGEGQEIKINSFLTYQLIIIKEL